jgi:hypothetical protein
MNTLFSSCNCARSANSFVEALVRAVGALEAVPGAATLLRNGGAELALKSHFLNEFESQLGCVAITELKRLDVLLVCRSCRGPWARAEFKHNFVSQMKEVNKRAEEARGQLRSAGPTATHSFYVHLIVTLAAPTDSPLRLVHDQVATDYKRFAANDVCRIDAVGQDCAWVQREAPIARTRDLMDMWDPTASARLHAWVQQL